jgi:hypothetical protein
MSLSDGLTQVCDFNGELGTADGFVIFREICSTPQLLRAKIKTILKIQLVNTGAPLELKREFNNAGKQ